MAKNRLLIIKIGALGDVLRTTGFLAGLHAQYAEPEIYWITDPGAFAIFENNPYVTRVLAPPSWDEIKEIEFSLVLSLDDEEEACAIAGAAKTKALIGAYIGEDGKRTYTSSSAPWFDMGLLGGPDRDDLKKANTRTYQGILSGILGIKADTTKPLLFLGDAEKGFQESFMQRSGISDGEMLIGVNTGAGGRWEYKKLSEQKTARLIDTLQRQMRARCVLLGGPEERERNARIMARCETPPIDAGVDNSLREFAAIIALCQTVITSDSLALHVATALGTRVVAFFGPTSSAEIALFGNGAKVTPPMSCLCCYKRTCDFNPVCMELITVDQLTEAVREAGA